MAAKRSNKDPYAYREKLPFMSKGTGLWNVSPTGDYQIDYQTGRQYALAYWRARSESPLGLGQELAYIIGHMIDTARPGKSEKHKLRQSGIEIGFVQTIGELIDAMDAATGLIANGPDRAKKRRIDSKIARQAMQATKTIADVLVTARHNRNRALDAARKTAH
jgi:hypothetical protein